MLLEDQPYENNMDEDEKSSESSRNEESNKKEEEDSEQQSQSDLPANDQLDVALPNEAHPKDKSRKGDSPQYQKVNVGKIAPNNKIHLFASKTSAE